jgi:hypothetical protein
LKAEEEDWTLKSQIQEKEMVKGSYGMSREKVGSGDSTPAAPRTTRSARCTYGYMATADQNGIPDSEGQGAYPDVKTATVLGQNLQTQKK